MNAVTVIIPAYNSAGCLGKAVESALTQEPPPLEVIVVNDGSTDDTIAVARSFGDRIVYLEQPNQGQGAARNAGLRAARGELIAFLDADDFWLQGFVAACLNFLHEHPEAVAVSTGLRIHRFGKPPEIHPDILNDPVSCPKQPILLDNFFEFWGKHDHVRTGSNMIRKSVIDVAGFQQSHLRTSQDLEYWAYIATFGKWGFIPKVLWVGDSETFAATEGWLKKYRTRRLLCPTVEEFQERIVPRLEPEEWPGFKEARGRTAVGFAQSHVLAGHSGVARQIVRNYGDEMPAVWSARVMCVGNRFGAMGWLLACAIIRARELQKVLFMPLKLMLAGLRTQKRKLSGQCVETERQRH